jgi:outer membrane lipoprotein-sorting protein
MEEKMKKIGLLTAALLSLGLGAFGQSGRDIMQQVEDQNTANTTQGRLEMRLIDASGDVSTRVIDQFMQTENDLTKAMVIFQSPANVKNTRFLTVENADRDDDRWIYLPNLRKTRRIAGSEGGESFMGSEFSYDDLSSRDLDDSTYTVLGEETVGGELTWKIEATPKADSDSQYSKVISWVSQEKKVAVKLEMYDKSGALLKTLEASNITEVQGIWTPILLKVTNVQTGNATELEIKRLIYDKEIPNIFTTRFLETGRP